MSRCNPRCLADHATETNGRPCDGLPYPDDRGQTHYDGCYRMHRHHNCAVVRGDELLELVRGLVECIDGPRWDAARQIEIIARARKAIGEGA